MSFLHFLAALAVGAIVAVVACLSVFGKWAFRRPAIRPDDSKAREVEDAKVKAADKARDEQKRQPLAEWINGRFGGRR